MKVKVKVVIEKDSVFLFLSENPHYFHDIPFGLIKYPYPSSRARDTFLLSGWGKHKELCLPHFVWSVKTLVTLLLAEQSPFDNDNNRLMESIGINPIKQNLLIFTFINHDPVFLEQWTKEASIGKS